MAASGDDNDNESDSGGSNPFAGVPFLGDIAGILGGTDEARWESARQTAIQIATGGNYEKNVEPVDRHRIEGLARVAELHVADVTRLDPSADGRPARLIAANRTKWATDALDAIRPLTDRLCERLAVNDDSESSPMFDPFEGLIRMMSPMMVSMSAAMMTGHLATRALGISDLAIPRGHDEVMIVPDNIAEFSDEWSLDIDDVTLWVAIRELTMHSVLSVPVVHARLDGLLHRYVDGFRRNARGLEDLGGLSDLGGLGELDLTSLDPSDPNVTEKMNRQLKKVFGSPELLLGMTRDEGQTDTVEQLESLLSVLAAYVDYVVGQAGPRLIGGYDALTEAQRRRQVAGQGEDFADRLLGVRLSPQARARGNAFVDGVIERAGRDGLGRLWSHEQALPTPNEVAAPGLWLARLEFIDD